MAADLSLEASRGGRADALLKSDIYQEAVGKVRNAIIDRWATSPVSDRDGQHELRLMLKLLNDLEGNIKTVADTGKLASIQIAQEQEKKSRLANIFKLGRG